MKPDESISQCWKQNPRWIVDNIERNNVSRIGMAKLTRWLAALSVIVGVVGVASTASAVGSQSSIAFFQGGTINLTQGWGSAQICDVISSGTYCFTDQSEYQQWVKTSGLVSDVTSLALCTPELDLYANIDYGGAELIVTGAGNWVNLSAHGFSDVVSSFKVGACAIGMADGVGGSGNQYPGPTSPGSNVSWIGTAWNDRIQSVYIY
jgi:hypothetical protein